MDELRSLVVVVGQTALGEDELGGCRAVVRCLGWNHYEFWTGVIRSCPAYRMHGRMFPRSNSANQISVKTWILEKVAEELERARQTSSNLKSANCSWT